MKNVIHTLKRLDAFNRAIGLPEFFRGLHYWLGFEYALALSVLDLSPGDRLLDIGTGAFSTLPYLFANLLDVEVVAIDIALSIDRQRGIRDRAIRSDISRPGQVTLIRGDARDLPFADESFDAFTAISSLEHVQGSAGDRRALKEAARTLRRGGVGIITVPFRSRGSMEEFDADFGLYQRHYSQQTLRQSFLAPSGLDEVDRVYYGERRPVYQRLKRLPKPVGRLIRPWNRRLSTRFMQFVADPEAASAVLVKLRRH